MRWLLSFISYSGYKSSVGFCRSMALFGRKPCAAASTSIPSERMSISSRGVLELAFSYMMRYIACKYIDICQKKELYLY